MLWFASSPTTRVCVALLLDNLVVSSLIISEIVMSIHVLIAVIFKDRDYDIVCQIDGVISFFTYNTGAMYFWALSHLISRLDTEKNPAGITT